MKECKQDRKRRKLQINQNPQEWLTEQGPLPVGYEAADVPRVLLEHEVHLEPVVGPAAELHLAALIIEGEPGDVDGAARLEHTRRDVGAKPLASHNHVGGVGRVEALTGAIRDCDGDLWQEEDWLPVVHQDVRGPDDIWREPQVLHIPVLGLIPPDTVSQTRQRKCYFSF